MEILAGLGFDGRPPNHMPPRFDVAVVGPEALLQTLEFWAGLVSPSQARAERVVRYHNALKAADGSGRFYHRSFEADPIASAGLLLDWRDHALNHGWSGRPGPGSPGRLSDLAEVESFVDGIAPCLAERVVALEPRANPIAAAVAKIVLADDPSDWLPPLRRLFANLIAAGIPVQVDPAPITAGAPAGSDLGRLQRALLDPSGSGGPLTLAHDGSLRLFTCLEPHGCATALCNLLAGLDDHLLVVGGDAFLLGSAARARGLPNPGLGERSDWRPQQQLLPLLIQVAWSPPAADVLLQYLTLPAGPLRRLRGNIARRFGDRPGHDPDVWQECIDDFVQSRLAADASTDENGLRDRIDTWLPIGSAGNRDRMPIALAIDLADQARDYWRGRFGQSTKDGSADAKELLAAFHAADAMACALRDWREAEIPREQLNRLLEIATVSSASSLGQPRQVSALNCVESPEAARMAERSPAQLVWWDPALGNGEVAPPFDQDELSALSDAPDESARQAEARSRLKRGLWPLVSATESALLVVKGDSGDLLRLHLDRLLPAGSWRSFEEDLLAGNVAGIDLELAIDLPLPQAQRWWKLDRPIPCPRERESYSGLAALALSPHDYVLKYAARLSEGSIVDVPVDSRLKGNLGHRLIEAWFAAHPWVGQAPGQAEVAGWLDDTLDTVIEANALPLAAPGKRAERLAFRDTMSDALFKLLDHLAAAGVAEVRVESRLEASLPGMELEGTVDLLARLADDRWAIVDIKWGSESQRAAELKEGRYLQLAVYAQLVEAIGVSGVADVAYFILKSGNLLSTSLQVFAQARLVEPDNPAVTPLTVWQRLTRTVEWRCGQLSDGRIEVTRGGVAATPQSQPPSDALPLLEMEKAESNAQRSGGRKPSFKPIDPWRVITGNIQP